MGRSTAAAAFLFFFQGMGLAFLVFFNGIGLATLLFQGIGVATFLLKRGMGWPRPC